MRSWLAFALVVLLAPSVARAQRERAAELGSPRAPASALALDLSASTILPVAVGATVGLELPGHVVLRVGGGVLPRPYVETINAVAVGAGAYDASGGDVALALLSDATCLHLGLAIRPAGTPGIELALSYLVLWTHRVIDMQALGAADVGHAIGLDTTIDAVHAELAYQTEIVDHLFFRMAIGWAHAVASRVTLRTDATDAEARAQIASTAATLTDALSRSAFGPTVSLSLGARL